MTFSFSFSNVGSIHRYYPYFFNLTHEPPTITFTVGIVSDLKLDSTVDWCEVTFDDNSLSLEFENRLVKKFVVNNTDFTKYTDKFKTFSEKGILPLLLVEEKHERQGKETKSLTRPNLLRIIKEELEKNLDIKFQEEEFEILIEELGLGSTEAMLKQIKSFSKINDSTLKRKIKNWTVDNPCYISLRDKLFAVSISNILSFCNELFTDFAENVRYIAPLRATAERYYRYQNLSVDEVDFQGQNLAMFIRNLSEGQQKQFSEWMETMFGFSPSIINSPGHVSLQVQQGEKLNANLADMGFGFSQVLPILTQLWQLGQKNFPIISKTYPWAKPTTFFVIEQPELHLHPRLQSKLAIAFANIVKQAQKQNNDVRLIIETHSDGMVNSFGRLIANGQLNKEEIDIVLFEKQFANQPSKIKISQFSDSGFLQNWPIGFFEPD